MKQKESYEVLFLSILNDLNNKFVEIESSLGFGNDVFEWNNLLEILNVEDVFE